MDVNAPGMGERPASEWFSKYHFNGARVQRRIKAGYEGWEQSWRLLCMHSGRREETCGCERECLEVRQEVFVYYN